MQPASPQPWTLFWPRSGEMPLPGLPAMPAASARLITPCALAVPFECWLMPMPQIMQEPLNGGLAKARAAAIRSVSGTPVISGRHRWRIFAHRLGPLGKTLGASPDELHVRQALVEQHVRQAVEQRDVGARELTQPDIGVVVQLRPLRIDDDQHRATLDRPTEAHRDHRVVGRAVRAHDHQTARVLVVHVRVAGRAAAERLQHRVHRRRMAQSRAVVDVVAVHDRAHELLDHVRVFVGALGRGERAERAAMFDEFVRDQIERLVPGGPFEHGRCDESAAS